MNEVLVKQLLKLPILTDKEIQHWNNYKVLISKPVSKNRKDLLIHDIKSLEAEKRHYEATILIDNLLQHHSLTKEERQHWTETKAQLAIIVSSGMDKLRTTLLKGRSTDGNRRGRRRLELADFESFDYDLDLDRVAIDDIVRNTLEVIKEIALKDKNKEAEFSKVVNKLENNIVSDEQKRLTRAQTLISCLYLFRDELITAEQELNPPYEIFIAPKIL